MPPRLRANASAARRLAHRPAPPRWPPLRRSLSAVTAAPSHECVQVPCRSNGLIAVDIFHAAKPSSPVIVHLPSGPVLPDVHEEEERVISLLRETTGATVARINYRASSNHQYPTPFHDVLYGFDWVRDHLLVDDFGRPCLSRMGVVGELVGGSLATMLALTECRLGESRIAAAAVNSPIVDWVFPEDLPVVDPSNLPEPMAPDETAFPADADFMASYLPVVEPAEPKTRKRTPKVPPQTAWQRYADNKIIPNVTLMAERDVLFSNPEDYLDRFASPIHFFRSPHAQLILPQQDDMFASRQPDELLDIEAQMSLDHYNALYQQASPTPELPVLSRCRAYARNYPPAGSNLRLPAWDITIGMESPLAEQAAELTKVLRRSVARQHLKSYAGRTRWHDATDKEKYEEYAAGIVHLNQVTGLGLWTEQSDATWESNMQRMGTWMKEHLESGKT
ncbi:Alpha/Beta hydrolase protein [Ampelomyces quisqualis]|uniref:Alpha/Beta hydrolase protein n=1 Tax=Ampelomyces quisqualis TaxID=50730 RepID=A0A6A5QCJ1_AMPQU|nr:Alpha/Beta hydrolase protein [Ampelomyces quisqualis]